MDKENLKSVFSLRIKELRKENKMNQQMFGNVVFVSQDTVSLWETGKLLPSAEQIYDICIKFNTTPDYLFGFID